MVTPARSADRIPLPSASRALLLGANDARFRELLTDVLVDLGLSLAPPNARAPLKTGAEPSAAPPDVVVVVIDRDNASRAIREAREQGGSAPVVAILPFGDALQGRRVMNAGADAIFELDAPLSHLRAKLVRLLEDRAATHASAGERAKAFQLGPRAKAALSAIRKNRSSSTTASAALPEDAGRRLEQAIDTDLHVDRTQAAPGGRGRFTFGSHAILELMLLSLSSFEISLLEHAISSDRSRQR